MFPYCVFNNIQITKKENKVAIFSFFSPGMSGSKPPFSVSAILDNAWNHLAEAAFNTGWAPITRLAEAAVIAYVPNHSMVMLN